MAAVLMLGDVKVAEWHGAGNPPWPVEFVPDGVAVRDDALAALWPKYYLVLDVPPTDGLSRGNTRGSPERVPG